MAMVSTPNLMACVMRESIKMRRWMDMGFLHGLMANATKVNGKKAKGTDRVSANGLMACITKENGRTINYMAMEFKHG